MAQASFPFEGIDTTETQFSKWARNFNNGVDDEPTGPALQVSAGSGLAVDVAVGEAMVRGHYYISDAVETLTLATADPTDDRIDLVVLKLDPTANSITLAVKTGTPAGSPSAPSLVQTDAGIYEQPLAEVEVAAASGVPGTITDRREFMGTRLGSWSTAGRPTPAGRVLFGFNTDTETIEFYNTVSATWQDVTPASIGDIGDVTVTSAAEGDALVYDGSGWVNTSQVSGTNFLYNGAMQVAQRGTSVTGATSGSNYVADRWLLGINGLGTWTETLESDGPTGSGFTKSVKVECTTADAAPAAGDYMFFQQRLEGQDLQGLKKGTSDAQSLTISFWVKSNVTGTYILELFDQDNGRQVSSSYTISASGTWEKKTITVDGDTTGAFDNDNAASLDVAFWLGAGSNFTSGTLNTSWATNTNANRAVGVTNLAASTSNYWQVTGVQLETGTVATGFDHKPYGVELAECQRYYYRIGESDTNQPMGVAYCNSATIASTVVHFPISMRTAPSALEQSGVAANYEVLRQGSSVVVCSAVPNYVSATSDTAFFYFTVASGLTAGEGVILRSDNGYLAWSAEL